MSESQPLIQNGSYHALDDSDYLVRDVSGSGSARSLLPEDPMLTAPSEAPAPPPPANPVEAARDTVGEQIFNTTSGLSRKFRIVWNFGELLTLVLVLILTRDRACGAEDAWDTKKLHALIAMYIFFTVGVIISLLFNWPVHQRSAYRFFTQASTVVGAISLFTLLESTCDKSNKPLFIVILVISSVNFLTVALPFLLLFLLLCCFPCLIVVLSFFPFLQDKEAGPATEEELKLLPSFIYSPETYDHAGEGYPDSTHAHTAELERIRKAALTNNNSRPVERNNLSGATPDEDHPRVDPQDAPQCAICLCEYEDGENLRRFHCHHDFHQNCIDSWLLTKAVCPVCRILVFHRDAEGNIVSTNGEQPNSPNEASDGTYQNPTFDPLRENPEGDVVVNINSLQE